MASFLPKSGRVSALTEVQALARTHTDSAISVLAEIMNNSNNPAAARVSAANSLLDRGWGRVAQRIELATPLERLDDQSLQDRIAERLRGIILEGESEDVSLPDPPQLRLVADRDAPDAVLVDQSDDDPDMD